MSSALCIEPGHGSVWLDNAVRIRAFDEEYIEGTTRDITQVGSVYLPDDYVGESVFLTFPASCLLKWIETDEH